MAKEKKQNKKSEDLAELNTESNILEVFGKTFQIPTSWQELTSNYIFAWVEAIRLNIAPKELLQFILVHSLNIKAELERGLKVLTKQDKATLLSEIFRASELLSFMVGENQLAFNPKQTFKGMATPNAGLSNFTAIEFVMATNYFRAFSETGEIEHLNKLCSVLLRASANMVRQNYSESAEHYAYNKSKELTIQERLIIYKTFEGEFLSLTKQYPEIFEGKENTGINYPYDLITNLAGDKFGTIKEVENQLIHILFQYITQRSLEVRNAERNTTGDELE